MNKSLKLSVSILALLIIAIIGFQNCSQKPLELSSVGQGSNGGIGGGGTGISTGLNATQANYTIDEGRTLSVPLSLSSPAVSNYSINWLIEPVDAGLVSTDDFDLVTGNFSIMADQTSGSINLRAKENTQVSVDKRYRLRVSFSGSSQPLILGLNLRDNDSAQVVAGYISGCVLKSGALKCFGYNNNGQLGNGNSVNQTIPVAVSGMGSGVQKVAVGTENICAIQNSQLFCWGNNAQGQLGNGTTVNAGPSLVPTMDSGITDVAVGFHTICAVKNGGVSCWGAGAIGAIGNGANTDRSSPTPVTGLSSGVIAVSMSDNDDNGAAYNHVCAIKTGGALYCWGYNNYGQLGEGTATNRNVPTLVSGMESDVTLVAAGGHSTCALRKDNLYCWGDNRYGQLGMGDTLERRAPIKVEAFVGKRISQIESGKNHYCAIAEGQIYCWGYNITSQIGKGNTTDYNIPTPLAGFNSGVTSISGSGYSSYAIQNNQLFSWGTSTGSDYGQLANGTTSGVNTPTMAQDLSNF